MVLQMYSVYYHRESQIPAFELIFDDELIFDKDAIVPKERASFETIQYHEMVYQCRGPREYLLYPLNMKNFNHVIIDWMTKHDVYRVNALESKLSTSTISDSANGSKPPRELKHEEASQPLCQIINFAINKIPQTIKTYKDIQDQELTIIHDKSTFVQTYADLKGIHIEVYEHQMILEENAKPVHERQHRLNAKYFLMVKEELNKLIEIDFIYLVPNSE